MAKWVIRRTIKGRAVSEAKFCTETRPVLRGTGVQTVEDCIGELLASDEHMGTGTYRRQVMRGDQVVGVIEVSDAHP